MSSLDDTTDDDIYYNWNSRIINQKYILIRKIGNGAYSSVWMAYNLKNKKLVAFKIHNDLDYEKGEYEWEKYNEIKKLQIPHILYPIEKIIINQNKKKHLCIVMDLMGCSLYNLIKKKGALSTKITILIIKQLLKCLSLLHENEYVHSDIKPENILIKGFSKETKQIQQELNNLITLNEIKQYVKKLDNMEQDTCSEDELDSETLSEISLLTKKSHESQEKDKTDFILDEYVNNPEIYLADLGTCFKNNTDYKKYNNTCYYIAPEIILKLECTYKADMWALGCTLYELLMGSVLFDPDDVKSMQNRYHLFKIINYLGDIPYNMKKASKMYDVYFRTDGIIKGITYINYPLIWEEFIKKNTDKLLPVLLKLLKTDPSKRIDCSTAYSMISQIIVEAEQTAN